MVRSVLALSSLKLLSVGFILSSCNELSNRAETESIKRAVNSGHAELIQGKGQNMLIF